MPIDHFAPQAVGFVKHRFTALKHFIRKFPVPSEAGSSYAPGTGNLGSNFQLPDRKQCRNSEFRFKLTNFAIAIFFYL
jgi:hypothetical protein